MDNFSPYSYTKITAHRTPRIGTTVKKSATATNLPHTASGSRLNMQKSKIPMQGSYHILYISVMKKSYIFTPKI